MKKSISILLSLALLLGSIASVLPLTVAATNTVWVQDFSAYDSNNRLEKTASVITGDAEHGSILDFSPATTGNAFASVFPGSGTAKQDTTKLLKAGVTYDVSLEYIINQAPGTASGDYGNFYISLIAANSTTFWGTSAMTLVERVYYGAVTNSWKSKTLTLTPTVDSYLVLRIGTNNASTVTTLLDISVDNVKVVEAPTGLNDAAVWRDDSPANYATSTKVSTQSTEKYYEAEGTVSDARSIKLSGWSHTAKATVEPYSTYRLSFWYYSDRDQTTNNFRLTSVQVQDVSLTATGNGAASTVGAGRYLSAFKDAVWNNIDAWQAKNNATNDIPGERSTWHHFEAEFASEQSTEIFITMTGNEFYLDDIVLEKVEQVATAYNKEVAIRTADNADGNINKQGMRVYNSVKKSFADTATEYGSIAIREGYLASVQDALETEEGLTLALYDAFAAEYNGAPGFGKGVSYSKADGTPILWETTEEACIFTAYLIGIDPEHYDDIYLIRSYAKDRAGNIIYGEIYEQSVYNVVYTIRTEYATDAVGMAAADAIIAEAKAADSDTVLTYAEWLTQNNRSDATYTE